MREYIIDLREPDLDSINESRFEQGVWSDTGIPDLQARNKDGKVAHRKYNSNTKRYEYGLPIINNSTKPYTALTWTTQ